MLRDAALARLMPSGPRADADFLDVALAQPARVLVLSFVAICALGTLLLGLPVAAQGDPVAWIDAAFTSVSATCVTGLAVVDTPTTYSGFGLGVILALIQVGGLGIMVFSAAMVVLLGRRLSLSHERAAADLVGAEGRGDLLGVIRLVFRVTLVTEGVAALLLFGAFLLHGDGVGQAAWRGLFTAISAFCNAGFALQSDSLVSYADSPLVLGVTGLTIVVGGLGPGVVAALWTWRRRQSRTLHVRMVLWTSALLIVIPTLAILALEWGETLGSLSFIDKLGNAAFQAVTLRTAGFNSIDLAAIQPATWTVMVLVMFVGGSPGSTAGGAKTTTIAVLVLAIAAVVRGRARVEVFGRALPTATVMRATAVTTVGVLACGGALFALQLTQTLPLDTALFEVVSALATVGLSTGATSALDDVGKLIIMACMFAGRVGPLTLFVFLSLRPQGRASWRFPEESVPIG
ncbi:MAG: potassium transporter TrkG [bacterium]